mmetsp:Transcript_39468/g.122083  ORF Transcript_39468/g.122083 Transcript_39468/m.122083 type:complete len:213 (-) Transcript_39468:42-680(-)
MRPSTTLLTITLAALVVISTSANDDDDVPLHKDEKGLPSVKEGDEEYHSQVPPKHMRCDACAASSFWIHRAIKLAHKEKFLKRLKEYDVIDAIDDICLPKTFSRTYGIKNINGRHRLSGGGLMGFYHQAPAVGTLMPGQWLNHVCRQIQGEFGEDELYNLFWKYHVKKGLEKSDVPFFRDVCIDGLKLCTTAEAPDTYDGWKDAPKETLSAK